jgi:hypothetical protein
VWQNPEERPLYHPQEAENQIFGFPSEDTKGARVFSVSKNEINLKSLTRHEKRSLI